jgi:hypothetical protein
MINHVINSPARIIITAIRASTESQTNSLVRSGLLGKWGIRLRARSSPADMAQTLHTAHRSTPIGPAFNRRDGWYPARP